MVLLMEFGYAFVEKNPLFFTKNSKIKRYSLVLMLQLLINLWSPHGAKLKKKKCFMCLSDDQAGIRLVDVFEQHHHTHLFFPFSASEHKRHYLM